MAENSPDKAVTDRLTDQQILALSKNVVESKFGAKEENDLQSDPVVLVPWGPLHFDRYVNRYNR